MGALDRPRALIAAAALLAVALGCSGTVPESKVGDWQTEAMEEIERTKEAAGEGEGAELPPSSTDAEEVAAEASAATAQEPVDRTRAVHFPTANPEGDTADEPTLFEASEAERQRRRDSPRPPSSIVITNANLDEYARGGQLSEMITERTEEDDAGDGAATPADSVVDLESYWRTRVRDARLAWRAAADRAEELDKQVAQLRYDFYAQDDPAYRDGEIKPAWDRAAIELTQARLRTADLESQVESILAEGLEAGALPGWLREGLDFEPESSRREGSGDESTETEDFARSEAIEPPIMDDPPL